MRLSPAFAAFLVVPFSALASVVDMSHHRRPGSSHEVAPHLPSSSSWTIVEMYDCGSLSREGTNGATLNSFEHPVYAVGPSSNTVARVVNEQVSSEIAPHVDFTEVTDSAAALNTDAFQDSCSSAQRNALEVAIGVANQYIHAGYNYMKSIHDITANTSVYVNWFGTEDAGREMIVADVFTKMTSNDLKNFTYICKNAAPDCERGIYAYVTADDFGTMYLCDEFFESPLTGYESQGSTLVHATTRFKYNGGTEEIIEGLQGCNVLAVTSPDDAVHNAGNYEYFSVDACGQQAVI